MKKLRVGSICSGIEAASEAWKTLQVGGLGMEFVFYSEIEPFPCAVLKQRHPEVPNLGDMTKFKDWPNYEKKPDGSGGIDIIIGGTPCQSFSVAGLRRGLSDPRGNLALTFLAIVERYQPTWVVWENVPGVHSSWSDVSKSEASEEFRYALEEARRACFNAGLDASPEFDAGGFEEVMQSNDFDCFLAALGQLGYGTATRIFDAQYFRVAQRRERVFVVGHLGGQWQRAAAVLFERESLRGDPPPRRETGKRIAPSVTSGPPFSRTGNERTETESLVETTGTLSARTKGGGGLGTDFDCSSCIPEVTGTLTKNYATHHGRTAGANGRVVQGQVIPINMQAAAKTGKKSPNMLGIGELGDPAMTVNASDQHAVAIPLQEVSKRTGKSTDDPRAGIGIGKEGDPSFTLQSGAQHGVAIGIDGTDIGFARSANPSHSGDKGDGGVNTTLVAEVSPPIKSNMYDNSDPKYQASMLVADVSPTLRSNPRNNSNPNSNADMLVAIQEDNQNGVSLREIAGSLRSDAPGSQPCGTLALVAHALKAEGGDASEDGTGRGTPLVPEVTGAVSSKWSKGSGGPSGDEAYNLIASSPEGVSGFQSSQSGVREVDTHATLDANNGSRRHNGVVQQMAVRRLTPRECERLQGFRDDYTLITWRGKPACDGRRYKAIGNSMAVPVIKWIGEQILKIHALP